MWMEQKAKQILQPLTLTHESVKVKAYGAEVVIEYASLRENGTSRTNYLIEYLLKEGVVAMWDEDKPFIRLQPALNLDSTLWEYALTTLKNGVHNSYT